MSSPQPNRQEEQQHEGEKQCHLKSIRSKVGNKGCGHQREPRGTRAEHGDEFAQAYFLNQKNGGDLCHLRDGCQAGQHPDDEVPRAKGQCHAGQKGTRHEYCHRVRAEAVLIQIFQTLGAVGFCQLVRR